MNDSALSISTKALLPAYGRAEGSTARATWSKGPTTNPVIEGSTGNPGDEAAVAPTGAWRSNELGKTQTVNPSQRADQATNDLTAKGEEDADSPLAAPGKGELEKAVESINDFLQSSKRSLEFSVDETSGRTVIKVMDAEREEVIRQIPPETALELMEKLRDGDGVAATGIAEKA